MELKLKDCSLIERMVGLREAMNLRELEERIARCPEESLFHHFCETVIRPSFDDPDYPNDLAYWVNRQLRDRILAEKLAIINPYKLTSIEELRAVVLETVQKRLSELDHIPWAPNRNAFHFMQAVTVVFDTGINFKSIQDLNKHLPRMALGSIYYHFVEARRRNENCEDDLTIWLRGLGNKALPLLNALNEIDFYFLSLFELKQTLIKTVERYIYEYENK